MIPWLRVVRNRTLQSQTPYIDGWKLERVTDCIFLGSKITADGHCSHEIKRRLLLGRKAMTNLHIVFKPRDITLLIKVHIVKAMVFLAVTYQCELWTIKKAEHQSWCFQTVVLGKTLESPLDSKEINPVNPEVNQSWTFIGRTDAKAPIPWPPVVKSSLIWKDHDVRRASLVAQMIKNPPACRRSGFDPWGGKITWRREWLPTPVFWPG